MKRRIKRGSFCLSLIVFFTFLLGITALAASQFPDVAADAEYAEAAAYLSENGIMEGDTSGNFNPDKYVTRAQMAAIICRMLGEEETSKGSTGFSDVPASYWASGYIIKATELGAINGYQDGTFKPDNTVTYEQAIAMIVRAMNLEEHAVAMGGYPDGYVKVAIENGYTSRVSAQKGEQLNRGEIAILVKNAIG